MDPNLQKELLQEKPTAFHEQILANSKDLVQMSRNRMKDYYPVWDANDETYRNRRSVDAEDVKASERREPIKMVVPISYAQVQSFVSFCFQLYTQRANFFELLPFSENDHKAARIGEAFLQRDLIRSIWEARLYQFLLDVAKYGVGILKTCWREEYRDEMQMTPSLTGVPVPTMARVPLFVGNEVLNISPYTFFPDPRLPISRLQEGEFVASEDVFTRTRLKQLEKEGVIAGVEFIPPITESFLNARGASRVYGMNRTTTAARTTLEKTDTSNVIVTEIQQVIIPSQFMVGDKPLGEDDTPTKYNIWYANDHRVIKCEPLGYAHGEFTYDVGEYNPDFINFMNGGLMETIDLLQDTMSWFVNSRVTNVRKIIGDRLLVDPSGVEMSDIRDRKPVIRLKPNVAKIGVDKFIKQLDLTDVTTTHVQDAATLRDFIQEVTGINDTLMGQMYPGRRSATENRNATGAAAARLKMLALVLYRTSIERMGRKMLSNLRDGLTVEQVVRLVGPTLTLEDGGQFTTATRADLIGQYDFELFDGTLTSEKALNAGALGEMLTAFIGNPQAALALQIDPQAVLLEYLELRGIRNPRRFLLKNPAAAMPPNVQPFTTPQPGPQGSPEPGTTEGPAGAGFESLLAGTPSGDEYSAGAGY